MIVDGLSRMAELAVCDAPWRVSVELPEKLARDVGNKLELMSEVTEMTAGQAMTMMGLGDAPILLRLSYDLAEDDVDGRVYRIVQGEMVTPEGGD